MSDKWNTEDDEMIKFDGMSRRQVLTATGATLLTVTTFVAGYDPLESNAVTLTV